MRIVTTNSKYLFVFFILGIIGVLVYSYVFKKEHRDINTETPSYVTTSAQLKREFTQTPSISEKKYLNKTIAITGNITENISTSLTLNNHIFCILKSPKSTYEIGQTIKLKGRVIGYDDLLQQVKLDQCTIIEP